MSNRLKNTRKRSIEDERVEAQIGASNGKRKILDFIDTNQPVYGETDIELNLNKILNEQTENWMVGTVNVFEKFKNYQRDLVSKIKNQKSKLTWNHTYEILAISSIMVITYPYPYKPFFTSTEWNEIMKSNLYKPCQPGLTKAISTSLLEASYNVSLNLDSELNLKDNEIGDKCKRFLTTCKLTP